VPEDRGDARDVRANVAGKSTTQTACDVALADVRDDHGTTRSSPEHAEHVHPTRVSASGGTEVDGPAGCKA